ncbi:hypothetical protein AGMMS4957_07740 [Bacteroidia bacterium]|nr:hypothetical protein AGMMS4957_07740 [Bacteroidia bacterium]
MGVPLTLTGTVEPANATYQTIIWSLPAGTTGATISGNALTATTSGSYTVTATISDGLAVGTPYTKTFTINMLRNIESAAFTSVIGDTMLTITLTDGTYIADLDLSHFRISTQGTGGFENLTGGTVTRVSNNTVIIILPAVTTDGSDQKITVAAAAFDTQSTSTAVTVVASGGISDVESGVFSSAVRNHILTITLTGGRFAASLSPSQFTLSTVGTPGFANLDGGTVTRVSDTEVSITGLTPVATAGSGQKITVKVAALATQATAVEVVASGGEFSSVESAAFTSFVGNHTLTITLTGGTYIASPSLSHFSISTPGTPGFANLTGGTVTRVSKDTVTITGLPAVTTDGSGQKITVAAAAFATQATSTAVTVVASNPVESAAFSSVVGNHKLTIKLTNGTFAPQASLSLAQFTISDLGTPGFTNLSGGTVTRVSADTVTITGLTPVRAAGSDQKITVAAAALATQSTSTAVTVEASGFYVDKTSKDLTIKFYKRTSEDVTNRIPLTQEIVAATFAALHNLIQGDEDWKSQIDLGDYIDLLSLTIDKQPTINDAPLGGNGNRLRLIVVGKNSFVNNPGAAVNNPDAPDHVVFQFKNIPEVYHNMNSDKTKTGGYPESEMQSYLTGAFLTGLKSATGLTEEMLWAPTRKVSNDITKDGGTEWKATETLSVMDTLWLPTEWEMFGKQEYASQIYEVNAGQARLEYYTDTNTGQRIKYNDARTTAGAGVPYWLASEYRYDLTPNGGAIFIYVDQYGTGVVSDGSAEKEKGCVPAFCVQ